MQRQSTSPSSCSARDRRDAWVVEQIDRTSIDDAMIRNLVDDFYDKIRRDPALAPIFAARVTDWSAHLKTMYDFWSGVALMTGRYKGKPVQKHAPMPLRPPHFVRWLHLFRQSANDVCTPAAAEFFISRAEHIAESLQIGIGDGGPSLARCTNIAVNEGGLTTHFTGSRLTSAEARPQSGITRDET